ncbi:hypothetical protein HBI15_183440 [Parastagonospora nodorum]|nr:hypothetical protein HBI15_183440 [Parastagonospora nodorum]
MRRPPIVCRRAVQSLQCPAPPHIWISDELLSSAFHRFFRSSCPHQKRHGSHVPGPLEARRRAAKRRMSLSSNYYPQDSFPSSFSLGALFGFASSSQPSWKYEPPSLRSDSEPLRVLPETHSPPIVQVPSVAHASPTPTASAIDSTTPNVAHITGEQYAISQSAGSEPVEVGLSDTRNTDVGSGPEAALRAFQRRIASAHDVSSADRAHLIVDAFHACCPVPGAWEYSTQVVREILHLKWDPKAILEQHSTRNFKIPHIYTSQALDLLVCLQEFISQYPHCISEIHQIQVGLARTALNQKSRNPYGDTRLLVLIKQLWHSAHLQGDLLDPRIIQLLRSIAQNFRNSHHRNTLSSVIKNVSRLRLTACVLHLMARVSKDPGLLAIVADVLSCIPDERVSETVSKITLDYARSMSSRDGVKRAAARARLHVWLQLLHRLDASAESSKHSVVAKATTTLAEHVFESRSHITNRLPTLMSALLVNASQTAAFEDIPMSKISDLLTAFATMVEETDNLHAELVFDMFMSYVKQKKVPHEALAQMIVECLTQYASLAQTAKFLQVLDQRQLSLPDGARVEKRIAKSLAAVQTRSNTVDDAFTLRTCSKMLSILGRISTVSEHLMAKVDWLEPQRQFRYILNHAQADHVLPLAYHSMDVTSPVEQRIVLIHQLAHQYTTDLTLSHNQAWRRVLYLYRYLQENSMPIGPLFTKAVVRSSIIRPMMENRFVSAKRLIWVYRLVERTEGEEVAKQIELLFWHWRGEVIQQAKQTYVSVGGDRQNKAHLGTMKKLGLT